MIDRKSINVDWGEVPLKKLRELMGMTQPEFAVFLGLSPSTVSRWERGQGEPAFTLPQLRKLLNELGPLGIRLEDLPSELGKQESLDES